jgi:hypothetical protein
MSGFSGLSYAEGAWVPDFTFTTAGNLAKTLTTQAGYYVKVGRLVTATFNLVAATFTHTTASGDLTMTGLPFPMQNASNDRWRGTMQFQGITKASYTNFTVGPVANTTTAVFIASGSGQSISLVGAADMPTGGVVVIQGSVSYIATT